MEIERSISVRGKGRDESQGIDINRQSKAQERQSTMHNDSGPMVLTNRTWKQRSADTGVTDNLG